MYSCCGRLNTSSAEPDSTTRPFFITMTRSDRSATTPMSWVMRMMPASTRCRRSRMSLRISAWTVTSRAVVGSSAMSSLGSQARAWAIIARWRCPPESWCGYLSTASSGLGRSTMRSSSTARARACFGVMSKCTRSVSTIWNPTVYTGFSAVIGSWKMTETSLPRTLLSCLWLRPSSSRPASLAEPSERPFGGSRPISDIDDCVLPEPDSPTIARTSPGRTS